MKTIEPIETLIYYDGVQVFAGRDPIGGHYVGMIIDTVDGYDRYLVTGARPDRLKQFRSGTLDLRTLLVEAPGDEWYITVANGQPGQPLLLEPQTGPLTETGLLPDEGLFLDDAPIDDLALKEARERGNVVFEFSIEPPEAELLSDHTNLGIETVTLTGELERVNRRVGDWGVLTDEGRESGKVAEGGPSLNGLEIGKRYRLECIEDIELDAAGQEKRTLYLQKIEDA